VSSAAHWALVDAVLALLTATPAMQLINPRVGFFAGADTAWHVDSNPRGAHPNAVRPLDAGFGLEVYNGVVRGKRSFNPIDRCTASNVMQRSSSRVAGLSLFAAAMGR
jgi:hypothetical protein